MAKVVRAAKVIGGPVRAPVRRSERAELLDEASHDPAELAENFRDIQRVNSLLGGTRVVLQHLPMLLDRVPADRPATILDLATGSADIPLAIGKWAKKRDRSVEITASDVSEDVLALARQATAGHPEITLAQHDARAVPLPDGAFDIVLCSLSLHHFAPEDAIRVLGEMERLARVGWVLNDLRRGRLGYLAAQLAARVTTRNRLTRHDAPLSVMRAYTPQELDGLLRRAGIVGAAITAHPMFRMAAVRLKEAGDV